MDSTAYADDAYFSGDLCVFVYMYIKKKKGSAYVARTMLNVVWWMCFADSCRLVLYCYLFGDLLHVIEDFR